MSKKLGTEKIWGSPFFRPGASLEDKVPLEVPLPVNEGLGWGLGQTAPHEWGT